MCEVVPLVVALRQHRGDRRGERVDAQDRVDAFEQVPVGQREEAARVVEQYLAHEVVEPAHRRAPERARCVVEHAKIVVDEIAPVDRQDAAEGVHAVRRRPLAHAAVLQLAAGRDGLKATGERWANRRLVLEVASRPDRCERAPRRGRIGVRFEQHLVGDVAERDRQAVRTQRRLDHLLPAMRLVHAVEAKRRSAEVQRVTDPQAFAVLHRQRAQRLLAEFGQAHASQQRGLERGHAADRRLMADAGDVRPRLAQDVQHLRRKIGDLHLA